MNKLFLMKNPELFQGENYLNSNKKYFEGWYFKNTNKDESISFIPGISINKNNKNAFIQVLTNDSSYFINYNINDFEYNHNPFYVKIGNNIFSKYEVNINIQDNAQNLNIKGILKYSNSTNIKTNFFNPNIMGSFSYVPAMECNHAILSMKNAVNGSLDLNNRVLNFNDGIGYIEKNWGYSFPKSYIWCQGNDFRKSNTSFMISVADIPFKFFNFRGIICSLVIDNQEFKFTTYNNTKIIKYDITNSSINITLKKSCYYLNIKSTHSKGHRLSAPIKGIMGKDIIESINSVVVVTLLKDNNVIFSDISSNCGLEIVLE